MEPANTIITRMGGPSEVAKVTGVHRTRVSNWKRPREVGGTGGRIPQSHIQILLRVASERGISLTAEDFLSPEAVA